jgi:hypothetical protein
MAVATVPVASESRPVRAVTARHTIAVEPFEDYRCPTVRMAVVERYGGLLIGVRCRDVDLLDGASLEDAARSYAVMFEADYVGRRAPAGMHEQAHPLAGQTVQLTITLDGTPCAWLRVADWWDRIAGKSWMVCGGSPVCLEYAVHAAVAGLPADDRVVYGKDTHGFGRLVHVTELGEVTC